MKKEDWKKKKKKERKKVTGENSPIFRRLVIA